MLEKSRKGMVVVRSMAHDRRLLAVTVLLVAAAVVSGCGLFGSHSVKVPDLKGMDAGPAAARLQDAGLTRGAVTEEYSETVAAGAVISSRPGAGSAVKKGDSIALVLSKGPDTSSPAGALPQITSPPAAQDIPPAEDSHGTEPGGPAETAPVICPTCGGSGVVTRSVTCTECGGTGVCYS